MAAAANLWVDENGVDDPFYGMLAPNHGFVGRQDILEQMRLAIAESRLTNSGKPLALTGIGGMGKTQLMLRYCYLHWNSYRYIFWVDADGEMTAADSFRKFACNLGLGEDELKNKNAGEVAEWI